MLIRHALSTLPHKPNAGVTVMAYAKRNSATVLADERARALAPIIEAITSAGHTTPHAIARELNRVGIRTLNKGRWHASTVKQLIARQRSPHYPSDCAITVDGEVIFRSGYDT